MAVTLVGNAGVVADVDEARNLMTRDAIPGYPAAGGFYAVSGHTSAAVAAALAANTLLMSARMSTGSTRKAYVTKFRVHLFPITGNAAAVVPGILGIQKFTAVTPTGGTARTAQRFSLTKGTATDITDIRDNNAALTGAPTFGTDAIVAQFPIPVATGAIAAGMYQAFAPEYIVEPDAPIELSAGDGIALRTVQVGPATCTWGYSYTMSWYER